MELKDTVELMLSDDYKERLKAEYHQTKQRYQKLRQTLVKYEAGTLDFTPPYDIDILRQQKSCMSRTLYLLEIRAEAEGITLE